MSRPFDAAQRRTAVPTFRHLIGEEMELLSAHSCPLRYHSLHELISGLTLGDGRFPHKGGTSKDQYLLGQVDDR